LSPILLLYASGFRYNLKRNVIQKTSALAIDSNPDKAQIRLNGELYKDETNTRITTLLPQEYDVMVSKAGYFDWRRTVNLKASEAKFLNQIQLFKTNIIPTSIDTIPSNLKTGFATSTSLIRNSVAITLKPKPDFIELSGTSLIDDFETVLSTLPKTNYEFIDTPFNWLGLKDTLNNILYLYHLDSNYSVDQKLIISDATGFDWHERNNQLVYYNKLELWILDLVTSKKTLITRVASGINNAKWHSSGAYIFYQNANKVKIIELVDVVDRQNYELIELSEINDMILNNKGDKLYLQASLGNQTGWFELEIQ
jgi:hypothetical protein